MSETAPVTLPLSKHTVERIDAEMASGQFSSREAVILEGLDALSQRGEDLEQWLLQEVLPTIDEIRQAPGSAIPIDEARRQLHAHLDNRLAHHKG
ncbi:MAG: type II toxin-antitoxin system ParD family antitoxin [Rhizobium rhizophilum]|uniref:type II toxin-antitoxin system ParD family antitoxin n=1 Tax=Rhizobium rhizophilum TaxID=1850373 RepID=UPI00391D89B5